MKRQKYFAMVAAFVIAITSVGAVMAQRGRWYRDDDITTDRRGVPRWDVEPRFEKDAFTFARVRYESYGGRGWGGGGWRTDYPDSDLNFSLRFQQLTSMKVNPDPVVVELSDEEVMDYPFLYMIEPGSLVFNEAEVEGLRRYCANGGFLMVDDFWGDAQYENLRRELKRVFPNRDPFEVPLSHEIFHCVYDLKEKPQVPASSARPICLPTEKSEPGNAAGMVAILERPITWRSPMMKTGSWSFFATTRIWATAGKKRAKTSGTSTSSRSRRPTRWESTS